MILKSLLITVGVFLIASLIIATIEGYDRLRGYIKWRWNFDIGPWALFIQIFIVFWVIIYVIVQSEGFTF